MSDKLKLFEKFNNNKLREEIKTKKIFLTFSNSFLIISISIRASFFFLNHRISVDSGVATDHYTTTHHSCPKRSPTCLRIFIKARTIF